MLSREPTIERLAVARALLLEPFGLTDAALRRALATIATHRIDDADLYFQYTRSEGWSLEEGHRQERQLRHRPGRGRACGRGREDRVRLLRRHLRSRAARCRAHRTHDCGRRRGAPDQACRQAAHRDEPRTLCADGPDRDAAQRRQGRAARTRGTARARQGPAHRPGDGRPGGRIRRGAGGARRRHAGGRCAPVGAALGDGDRRADGGRRSAPRSRQRRRRRALRLRVLRRRDHRWLRARRRQRRAHKPRIAPGQGRRDERRARTWLARRAAARSDRPRPRRRLQPQGLERLQRTHRPARRGQGRDGARRRHAAGSARLAQRRRRGQRESAQRADRRRHPEGLHPGLDECAPDGRGTDRQRPARKLRRRADAAHDQHLHAGWRQDARRNRRRPRARPLCHQLRRRPGRHHERQVRVLGERGVLGREGQDPVSGQGRDHHRQTGRAR